MSMERLSHDLTLALEESSWRPDRRKRRGELRRRTLSAGNLPAAVAVSTLEDGSSSSPPQAPVITQPLSDSDDPHINVQQPGGHRGRHYCHIGNFESDSFNENFSPTRPVNTKRKRKFKKIPVDYIDGNQPPPLEILPHASESNLLPSPSINHKAHFISLLSGPSRHSTIIKERNIFCGKRKWSQRDMRDEMRERSFSGGYASKLTFLSNNHDFLKPKNIDKKKKDTILQPGKFVLKASMSNTNSIPETIKKPIAITASLPGSSSFNFVYKTNNKNGPPQLAKLTVTGYRKTINERSPFFNPIPSTSKSYLDGKHRKSRLGRGGSGSSLRNPLSFDDSNSGMECGGNESSSLSSSDSDGLFTNESDREGDDELTDWPGIEELKVFNKTLTFKTAKVTNSNPSHKNVSNMPPPKRLKKDRRPLTHYWTSCKNKFKKKMCKADSGNDDDDAVMSDSQTVVDVEDMGATKENIMRPPPTFSSFSDVKNAGVSGKNANMSFYQSFQAFDEKSGAQGGVFNQLPRTNFTLQKTSSSDLNVSEKSPLSDHYGSEPSGGVGMCEGAAVREIRAGCRRVRDERPGLLIHSAANEQLAKFLQDSRQTELKLPASASADIAERDKLHSLAKLYSLDMQLDQGRPVLRKTSNTTQAVSVEHSCVGFPLEFKRRCYGEELEISEDEAVYPSPSSLSPMPRMPSNNHAGGGGAFSTPLVSQSLLHPGDVD